MTDDTKKVLTDSSGMVLVRFSENGKEQIHDWYFDGKDWRCGLTDERLQDLRPRES